jgi:peptidoglycan/LPS O-acetylase OafA/YrhL
MTDTRERPPLTTAPAAPAAANAPTQPGRVVGLDGIRGPAALLVVLNHIFERA